MRDPEGPLAAGKQSRLPAAQENGGRGVGAGTPWSAGRCGSGPRGPPRVSLRAPSPKHRGNLRATRETDPKPALVAPLTWAGGGGRGAGGGGEHNFSSLSPPHSCPERPTFYSHISKKDKNNKTLANVFVCLFVFIKMEKTRSEIEKEGPSSRSNWDAESGSDWRARVPPARSSPTGCGKIDSTDQVDR